MSTEFIFRIIGMVVFGVLGAYIRYLYRKFHRSVPRDSRVLILPGRNIIRADPDALFHHATDPVDA